MTFEDFKPRGLSYAEIIPMTLWLFTHRLLLFMPQVECGYGL